MRVEDTDVLVKIMYINSAVWEGASIDAYILSINNEYRATFRHKEDLDRYIDHLKSSTTHRLVFLEAYKTT